MGYGPPRYGKTGLVGAAMGAIAPFAFGRLRRGEDVGGRGGGDVFFPFVFLAPPKIHRVSQQKTQRLFGGEERKSILGRDFVVFFFHGFYGLFFFLIFWETPYRIVIKVHGRICAKNSWDVYESKWQHLDPFGPGFFYIERVAPLMATMKSARIQDCTYKEPMPISPLVTYISPEKWSLEELTLLLGRAIFRGELLVLGRVTIGKPPTRWQGYNGRVVHFSFSNRSRFTQTQASNRHLAYQLLTRKSRNAPCWLFPSMLLTTKSTHVSIVPWSMLKKYHLKFFPPRNQHGSNGKPPSPTVGLLNPQVLEKTSRNKNPILWDVPHFQ